MKRMSLLLLSGLLALTACGLDGEPEPQTSDPRQPGISVSGDARIRVVGSL